MHQKGNSQKQAGKEKESPCPEGTVLQKTHHQLDDVKLDDN